MQNKQLFLVLLIFIQTTLRLLYCKNTIRTKLSTIQPTVYLEWCSQYSNIVQASVTHSKSLYNVWGIALSNSFARSKYEIPFIITIPLLLPILAAYIRIHFRLGGVPREGLPKKKPWGTAAGAGFLPVSVRDWRDNYSLFITPNEEGNPQMSAY